MKRDGKIFMQSWLQCHPRTKPTSTDVWYLDCANKLLPLIDSSRLYEKSKTDEKQHAAVLLTLYLEDCIANKGGWRCFTDLYHKRYNRYLPFYEVPDDYIPDEINEADVAFILWKLNSSGDYFTTIANPFDERLLELAAHIYKFLDEVFEQAPVCSIPSGDWVLPSEQLLVERTVLPEITPDIVLPESVELFLKASNGNQLMYFSLYEQMEVFFVENLHWDITDMPDKPDDEIGDIVVFANPKGILIAPSVARFFYDERNAKYDKAMAMEEGYKVFTDKGRCPFDLLKYAVGRNLFPEAQLPFSNGKKILWENWDFIARWFLGEYYEGV